MSIQSRPIELERFAWDLKALPDGAGEISAPFVLRHAGEQEADEVLTLVQASYNLDPEWSGCASHIKDTVLPGVMRTLAKEPSCLFVQHGNRVIAASVYDCEPGKDGVHLVSGPCVLIEYRSRGIGAALLGATLEALRNRGLNEATGHTKPKSPSAKYLFTKFGGKPAVFPRPAPAALQEADAA
jgi:hypothetical protein